MPPSTTTSDAPLVPRPGASAGPGALPGGDRTVRGRIERSASGAAFFLADGGDRIALDLHRLEPGTQQALAALFARFFAMNGLARGGRISAAVTGRVGPGAFGFGHLAVTRPVLVASMIRLASDEVEPL